MKTKNKIGSMAAGLLLFLVAFAPKLNAQIACAYPVANHLNCAIKIQYTLYDASCTALCSRATNVPALTQILIGNGCMCSTAVDIEITVVEVGGVATGATACYGTQTCGTQSTTNGSTSSSCSSTSAWTETASATITTINP